MVELVWGLEMNSMKKDTCDIFQFFFNSKTYLMLINITAHVNSFEN